MIDVRAALVPSSAHPPRQAACSAASSISPTPLPHASFLSDGSCLMGACSLRCLDGLTDAIHYHTFPHIYCTLLADSACFNMQSPRLSLLPCTTHTHTLSSMCVCVCVCVCVPRQHRRRCPFRQASRARLLAQRQRLFVSSPL